MFRSIHARRSASNHRQASMKPRFSPLEPTPALDKAQKGGWNRLGRPGQNSQSQREHTPYPVRSQALSQLTTKEYVACARDRKARIFFREEKILFHISDSTGCQVGGSVRREREQWPMTKAGLSQCLSPLTFILQMRKLSRPHNPRLPRAAVLAQGGEP